MPERPGAAAEDSTVSLESTVWTLSPVETGDTPTGKQASTWSDRILYAYGPFFFFSRENSMS